MPSAAPRWTCCGATWRKSSAGTSRRSTPIWPVSRADARHDPAERTWRPVLFFGLNTWVLVAVLAGVLLVATVAGLVVGRTLAARSEQISEPFGVLQGA